MIEPKTDCPHLLLGVDLEDIRYLIPGGREEPDRVCANTELFIDLFNKLNVKATFFTVGEVARQKPDLIRRILSFGHEVACHGNIHTQLEYMDEDSFREDLEANLEALSKCGASFIKGFRAPTFSLTDKTGWVYPILREFGFIYSSSVLPANNPLYGWPEFGSTPRMVIPELLEIPITVYESPFPRFPVAGGSYFRVLPFWFSFGAIKRMSSAIPVTTYFHPFDVDVKQESFCFSEFKGNLFYQWLMGCNRDKTIPKLEMLIKASYCDTYGYYANLYSQKSSLSNAG